MAVLLNAFRVPEVFQIDKIHLVLQSDWPYYYMSRTTQRSEVYNDTCVL